MGTRILIDLPGIAGDVKKGPYAGWIEALSISFGRPGGSSRKPLELEELDFTLSTGPVSEALMRASVEGKVFSKANVVMLLENGGDGEVILSFKLTGAMILSISVHAGGAQFQLGFDKVTTSDRGSAPAVTVTPKRP